MLMIYNSMLRVRLIRQNWTLCVQGLRIASLKSKSGEKELPKTEWGKDRVYCSRIWEAEAESVLYLTSRWEMYGFHLLIKFAVLDSSLLDANMTMVPQVSNCVRSSVYHLRNINRIRQHLNSKAAQQSCLRSHRVLTCKTCTYFGLPNLQIYFDSEGTQCCCSDDHTSATVWSHQLCNNWLPVKIVFKVLTLTFKPVLGLLIFLINVEWLTFMVKNYLKRCRNMIALSWQRLHVYGMHFPWHWKSPNLYRLSKRI